MKVMEEEDKIHKGVFSFLSNNGCSIHDMRRILSLYGLELGIKRPKNARLKWYSKISNEAQKDFKSFLILFL